ncbi:MAG: AAA family ATPase [Methyloprofundus sp.]|nr:AAA family ATPase [Methyloprofundus sp.]
MKIEKLTLKNFRCYADTNLEFDPRVTVLVAANGQGKTSVLDALRIAIWPFVSQFDLARTAFNDPANTIRIDDVRSILRSDFYNTLQGERDEMARQLPCEITFSWVRAGRTELWVRRRESEVKKSQTLDGKGCKKIKAAAKSLQEQVRDLSVNPISLPLFGYYGTGRLWSHKRLKEEKRTQVDLENQKVRTFAYQDCLDPASSYRQFELWFTGVFKGARDQQIKSLEKGQALALEHTPYYNLIRVIQRAIDVVLKPVAWHTLEFSQVHEESLIMHSDQGEFKVAQLSDGIKNILGLVADIAYRCVLLNPHLGDQAALKTEGVVMIDEVDMHLHPSWQQTVVNSLIEAFPKIQFVLTTHSPQVLTTVPSQSIRILDNGKVFAAPAGSEGAEAARLLNRIFAVQSRPPQNENTKLLNAYADLVYQDKWVSEQAVEMRRKLDAIYRGEEPKLTELDLYIENRDWELNLEKDQ